MKISPLGDRIAVIADKAEQQTESGLFIATKANDIADTGTVVAVGPKAVEFKENDKIIFVKSTGKEVKLDGVAYTMLLTEEVIGIIRDNELLPVRDIVVCKDADFGDQTTSAGIIIKSNIKESQGIASRWMQVHKVGPDITFTKPGEWVLVEYGRWTESFKVDGIKEAYRVDPKGCLAVSDDKPETLYYNSDVIASEKKKLS